MCHTRGGFLQHPGIPLYEEDVEQQVEGQWSEVDERGEKTPVLYYVSISASGIP